VEYKHRSGGDKVMVKVNNIIEFIQNRRQKA
jgi:prolyl-tRNA synthetase